jgi:hypothetical protein
MKAIRLLIIFLVLTFSGYVFSQDTIRRINSNCIEKDYRSAEAVKYNVALVSDSVIITWRIEAGCGSKKGAIIQKLTDRTYIKIIDTFISFATCLCDIDLRIALKASTSDTLIQINDDILNISYLYNGIQTIKDEADAIDVYYNSKSEYLSVKPNVDCKIKYCQLYDEKGQLQLSISSNQTLTDMHEYLPGIYILNITLTNNKKLIRKFVKY